MLLPEDKNIFAYARTLNKDKIVVLYNFYGEEINYQLPKEYEYSGDLLISNYEDTVSHQLRPYEALMYKVK